MSDKLDRIFELQRVLMRRLDVPQAEQPGDRTPETLRHWHKELGTAIMIEAAELFDWAPWKHWSTRSGNKQVEQDQLYGPEHLHEIKMEIVDVLHFTLELAIVLGMTASDVYELYLEKNKINHERKKDEAY